MNIVRKHSLERGPFLINLENGDWFSSASSEMGAIPSLDLDAPRYYRLNRSEDRQMFEITVRAERPDRQTRRERLELEAKGLYRREQALEDCFKEGQNIVISSNWGVLFSSRPDRGFYNVCFRVFLRKLQMGN